MRVTAYVQAASVFVDAVSELAGLEGIELASTPNELFAEVEVPVPAVGKKRVKARVRIIANGSIKLRVLSAETHLGPVPIRVERWALQAAPAVQKIETPIRAAWLRSLEIRRL